MKHNYYHLPNDIASTLHALDNAYPFDVPSRTKSSKKALQRHGFHESVAWDCDTAMLKLWYAIVLYDCPDKTNHDGHRYQDLLKRAIDNNWHNYEEAVELQELERYLFRALPLVVTKLYVNHARQFLRQALVFYKRDTIVDLEYHIYNDKTQRFWLDWLIEHSTIDSTEQDFWNVWAETAPMFWW